MVGYIYKVTNNVTGLIYVGQKRSSVFLGKKYLGSGTKIKAAVREYGRENFKVEMLEAVDDLSLLEECEVKWIIQLNATDPSVGYNIYAIGRYPVLIGESNPFFGKTHTAEAKEKMRKSHAANPIHRKWTDEEKSKQSLRFMGRNVTWGDKIRANAKENPNYGMRGQHVSEETKAKLSAAQLKVNSNPEVRKNKSNSALNSWQNSEYRQKHIANMKGKKHSVSYKTCPECGRKCSASNYGRHIATHCPKASNDISN